MFETLLVAVDGSQSSRKAVQVASELAQKFESRLIFLHVIRSLPLPKELKEMIEVEEVVEARLEILHNSAEIMFEKALEIAEKKGVTRIDTEIREGDPASEIVKVAEKYKVEMIIMGTRGLSDLDGMFMGSVSRKVSYLSSVHCLTIK